MSSLKFRSKKWWPSLFPLPPGDLLQQAEHVGGGQDHTGYGQKPDTLYGW